MAGYIEFDGIKGNSLDEKHKDWIDIQSFSQNITRPSTAGKTGVARSRASAVLSDVHITKLMDKSSAKLIQAVASGQIFKTVKIDLATSVGSKGERTVFWKWELKNVIVSSYDLSGTAGDGGDVPMESIALNCEEIKWIYVDLDKEGKSTGNIDASWKVEEGKA